MISVSDGFSAHRQVNLRRRRMLGVELLERGLEDFRLASGGFQLPLRGSS